MKKSYRFMCKKCHGDLIVGLDKVEGLEQYDCPNCGEEGYLNWIYSGMEILHDIEDIDSGGS